MSEAVKPNSSAEGSYTLHQKDQPGTVLGWFERVEEPEEPSAPPPLPPLQKDIR